MDFSFIWIILVTVDYGVTHSFLASHFMKRMVEKQYPRFYSRYYRLAYNIFAAVGLLPIGLLLVLLPDRVLYRIPVPFVAATLLIQAAAAWGAYVSLKQAGLVSFLGIRQAQGVDDNSEKLFTGGLYRLVRHPVYVLGFIIMALVPVMTVNLLALVATLSIYMVAGAYLEERRMAAQFGQEYEQYRAATPMFIPDLSRLSELK